MFWYLLVFVVVSLVATLFAKRITSWLVFGLLSKVLRCNSLKFSHVGIFSIADVKVRFTSFTLEFDNVWLSSSFFNQSFTKPIVVCLGDVRLEAHKTSAIARRLSSSSPQQLTENSNSGAVASKIRQFSSLLQYVAMTVNNLDIVVLDVLLKDCLVHLAFEQIDFDTFRDRDSIQVDLCWKMMNFKMLHRAEKEREIVDSASKTNELLHVAAESRITLHLKPAQFTLTGISVKIISPAAAISDAVVSVVPWQLDSKDGDNSPKLDRDVDPNSIAFVVGKLERVEVDCSSVAVSFFSSHSKQLQLCVKSVTLRGSANQDGKRVKLDVNETCLYGHRGSVINVALVDSELEMMSDDIGIRCYVENVTGHLDENSVSYWHQFWREELQPRIASTKPRPSPVLQGHRVHVNFEVASVAFSYFPPDSKPYYLSLSFASYSRDGATEAFEICLDSFTLSNAASAVAETGVMHHQWGDSVCINVFIIQVEKESGKKKVRLQLDQAQFEWIPSFIKTLISHLPRGDNESQDRTDSEITLIAKITDVGIYMPVENGTCIYLLAQSLRLDNCEKSLQLLVRGLRLGRQDMGINRGTGRGTLRCDVTNASGKALDCSQLSHAKLTIDKQENVTSLHCGEGLVLSWSPILHYLLHTLFMDLTMMLSERGLLIRPSDTVKTEDIRQPVKEIRVHLSKQSQLNISLEGNHLIVLTAVSFKIRKRGNDALVAETKSVNITIDENPLFLAEPGRIEKMQHHPAMVESRCVSKGLVTLSNPVWVTTLGKVQAIFPYDYNFALVCDEFLTTIKWLKLLHGQQKAPFTVASPLPPDLMVTLQEFVFELSDDPFEVRLRDNYLLLMDEYLEGERRFQMLDAKLDELRKVSPLLPQSKVQELHSSLLKKNSDIYIQRSKRSYGEKPSRTQLCRWSMKNVGIKAMADLSLHGEENATAHIRAMNPESAWPSSIEFNTLWCRMVECDFEEWLMTMRDYPQPYVSMADGHLWGKLAGAEAEGSERAKRTVVVDLGPPFRQFSVLRNMPSLKFYYDLCSDIKSYKCAYGPCWEPCLAMINICLDKINKPSVDPSPPLPFWDKIRLLFHGRLSLACDRFVAVLLASTDPYNTTEQMEWTFSDFQFDWTSGRFAVMSDLDVYIRTASKYDDCRLLHLPDLRLNTKLHWVCTGDPTDHHSLYPCAPDKLPDYSVHKEHDSYRAFRSQHLNVSLSLNIKQEFVSSDSQCPQLLLYANTVRWLDGLKNTISAVHRPIRRGPLFKNTRQKKLQLSRHYKNLQLSLSLPRFIISYWYSFSSDRGLRIIGQTIQFSSAYQLEFGVPRRRRGAQDNLSRRSLASLRVVYMNAELLDAEVYLFSERPDLAGDSNKSFFIGVNRWTYCREMAPDKASGGYSTSPTHKVVVHDFKGAWTSSNRDVVLFILDGLQKATVIRRNLSAAALKRWQVAEEQQPEKLKSRKSTSAAMNDTGGTSPSNRADGAYASNLLEQLIAEADTKFMAYSETSEMASQQLHGIALCQTDDEIFTKWQIELINSQVALKGCETGGYVLCTAARALVTQKLRAPVWRENQLLGKVTWVAMLNGMQYYATVGTKESAGVRSLDDVKWLTKELIEERSCSDQSLDVVESFCSKGEAAGSVVSGNAPSDLCPQLQRVVSRCSCQLYFCHFTDSTELDDDDCSSLPPLPDDDTDAFWEKKEYVDCFTLKHNTLNISTNPLQYQMILDIVNNLLLYVDPKKKESAEKLLRYRFQLQLQSVDDLRPNIMRLQEEVRQLLNEQRYLERQIYFATKQVMENNADVELLSTYDELNQEMEAVKGELQSKNDDLAMTISCFREKQIQRQRSALACVSDDQQTQIARRFEVCFEDAQWRLTAVDGQLGLSDLQIRNFLYTKISRINDSGEHLLEIGFVKITNLLPNSPYRDVLQMQSRGSVPNERQPGVRVICRDLAPVGGISVKEHFEVNVVPMVVQISYVYFRTMMDYFFPDRNIDTEDQQNLDNGFEHGGGTAADNDKSKVSTSMAIKSAKSGARKRRGKEQVEDDVDKMKQRAEKNNMFLYIKIPEVPFLVSYKGEKEKNIEDVENFQLEFPLVEYHERNWTWLDLALAIKQRCKRVLLQQFMKQKLLRSRLGAAFGGSQQQIDPVNLPEEEKARLLLGTKLMGTPDKTSKKGHGFLKGSKH